MSRGSIQSNANPSPPVRPPSVGNYAVNFSGDQITGPSVSPAVTPPGQPFTNVTVNPTVPGYYVVNPAVTPAVASKCETPQKQGEGSATHTYYICAQNSVLLQTAKVIASSPDGKHGELLFTVNPTVPGYYVVNPAVTPAVASKCETPQKQGEGSATHTYYICAQNSVLLQTAKVIASSPDGKHGELLLEFC